MNKNSTDLFFKGQLVQKDEFKNIRGGKRSLIEILERRRIKRGTQQIKKIKKELKKSELKIHRLHRFI